MSRNLKSSVIAAHPSGVPTVRNVVGLDGVVFAVTNTRGHIINIVFPWTPFPPGTASPNNDWRILLAGINGTGGAADCADPARLDAMYRIAYLQGSSSGEIEHFYRPDDNSGTTETIKEKLGISGFCNGTAIGIRGANQTNPNLKNQDLDPIRRPCVVLPSQRATACSADGTQGLLVALPIGDNDTYLRDVTTTIGERVSAARGTRDVMGFASREAYSKYKATVSAVRVNGVPASNKAVRANAYYLSRRLYLHFAAATAGLGTCGNALATSGGAPRVAAEEDFYAWATDPDILARCNLDPILAANGFIPCLDDCTVDPALYERNFCNGPYPPSP
jgi:ABC-type phosphate transport system substrate-binding protein